MRKTFGDVKITMVVHKLLPTLSVPALHLLQSGHGRGELLQPRETEPGEPGERLVGVHAADRPLVGGEFLGTIFNQLEQNVKGKKYEQFTCIAFLTKL